jgi:hypothetical protein
VSRSSTGMYVPVAVRVIAVSVQYPRFTHSPLTVQYLYARTVEPERMFGESRSYGRAKVPRSQIAHLIVTMRTGRDNVFRVYLGVTRDSVTRWPFAPVHYLKSTVVNCMSRWMSMSLRLS